MLAQLGPYLIDEELAEGGMARVFRARLRGLGGFEKQLVIKQIRPELARDPRFVELFVREANTLVTLSHPHIVQVYELGAAEGTYYLSMEYVEGATIASMLQEGPLTPALSAHVGAQICEALDYAHVRFGILHRDITPRNIIVDQAGHGRLLDFGIATSLSEHDREQFGSPGYMSPEQVSGGALGPETDLFSLGCVLFEALTGQPAFPKTLRATLGESVELGRLSALPEPLARLVAALLTREPAQRPPASEVARILRGYLAQARPEGVLHDMQARSARAANRERAQRARALEERKRAEHEPQAAPSADAGTTTSGSRAEPPATTRIAAQSLATSPVLTELMRSSGLAPIPQPPGASPTTAAHGAPASEPPSAPATRRFRERAEQAQPADAPVGSGRATRFMLKAWPSLAGLSLVVALGLAWLRPHQRESRASAPGAPTSQAGAPRAAATGSTPGASATLRSRARGRASTPPANTPANTPPNGAAQPSGVPPELAPATPSAAAGLPNQEAVARATLSINALPWAEVSIDGRSQGTTPLRRLKLRPGIHRVELKCPPLGREETLSIELSAKADARMVVDLQQTPPRTFLDGAKEVR